MRAYIQQYIPQATPAQADMLLRYYELLVEWNGRMNLTAVTEAEAVAQKHFADSLLPMDLLPQNSTLIDVGTGAGFPGLPLRILRPDIKLTLLDSLAKRVTFLQAVCAELGLADVRCIHARAEDGARDPALRGRFDVAAARAVAATALLCEWTVPFLKTGGQALLYKGPQAAGELAEAENACKLLQCTAELIPYNAAWGERSVVVLHKQGPTPKLYPRKAGSKGHL